MFYVYHKVKGDRFGPADYSLLAECNTRNAAEDAAIAYNKQHGYKADGFHRAVVRVRKVGIDRCND